ncbi:hypothetical protein ACTFIW_011762 [Dictyostelium discoideum]
MKFSRFKSRNTNYYTNTITTTETQFNNNFNNTTTINNFNRIHQQQQQSNNNNTFNFINNNSNHTNNINYNIDNKSDKKRKLNCMEKPNISSSSPYTLTSTSLVSSTPSPSSLSCESSLINLNNEKLIEDKIISFSNVGNIKIISMSESKFTIYNSNNTDYKELLFWKVWRNFFLKNEILFHQRLYNLYSSFEFNDLKSLLNFQYREYLQNIRFSFYFDEPLSIINFKNNNNIFPNSVKKITFGYSFNQAINQYSFSPNSSSLTSLEFGESFNQDIQINSLPPSLTCLKFGKNFNCPLSLGVLPLSGNLKSISFGLSYNQPIQYIPNGVEKLKIGGNSVYNNVNNNNKNNNKINKYPNSIKIFKFDKYFNDIIMVGTIPNSVLKVKFGVQFNREISMEQIPLSVTEIDFGFKWNQPLNEFSLPKNGNLKSIIFSHFFNQPINANCLPDGLTHLKFGPLYSKEINFNHLPSSIEILMFHNSFQSLNLLKNYNNLNNKKIQIIYYN